MTVQDTPVLLFMFFLIATTIILGKFLVNTFYGIIDPCVQVGS